MIEVMTGNEQTDNRDIANFFMNRDLGSGQQILLLIKTRGCIQAGKIVTYEAEGVYTFKDLNLDELKQYTSENQ